MYYYLISSLPDIRSDAAPPLSMDEFTATCRDHLSDRDYAALEAVLDIDRDPAGNAFAKAWQAHEIQLRNAAARHRAHRRKSDAVGWLREHPGFDVRLDNKVEEAFNRPTPLEREKALDDLRMEIADDLAGTDPFATSVLLAYAIKLKIASRWHAMDAETGRTKIKQTISNIQEKENIETEEKSEQAK